MPSQLLWRLRPEVRVVAATHEASRITLWGMAMSEYFLGQIMMTGFNFAPRYFAQCNGQLLPISQNQALFSLLGTQYGGNGQTNFALPDLRSRTPIGYASSVDSSWQPPAVQIGELGGSENVTLLNSNLPAHLHAANASSTNGDNRIPVGRVYATSINNSPAVALYASASGPTVTMAPETVVPAGGTQPHSNLQPYEVINFCIALSGIFPSRN